MKKIRVSITVEKNWKEFGKKAKQDGCKRSTLIQNFIREYIKNVPNKPTK